MTPPLHAFRAQGFGGLYAVATDVYLFLRVEDIAFAWCQLLPRVEFTERGYPFVSIQTWEGLLEKIRQCVAPAEGDDDDALVSARTSNVPGRRAQPRAGDRYTPVLAPSTMITPGACLSHRRFPRRSGASCSLPSRNIM